MTPLVLGPSHSASPVSLRQHQSVVIAGLGNYLVCNLFASLLSLLLPRKYKDNEGKDFACLLDDCVFSSENSVWHVNRYAVVFVAVVEEERGYSQL